VCSLTNNGFDKIISLFKRIYLPFCIVMLAVSAAIYFFSNPIIVIIAGEPYPEAIALLQILSIVPFIIALNVPAYQVLLAYNLKRSHTLVFTFFAVVNIMMNLLLAYNFSSYGTAFCVVITQLLIAVSLYLILELRHKEFALL